MPFFKKSNAKVASRRGLKARAINAICAVAYEHPLSASRGNRIADPEAILDFQIEIAQVLSLPGAQPTFLTAKGCKHKPARAINSFTYNDNNFHGFLRHLGNTDCLGSYMEVAWGWAVQIMKENPHTFPGDHPAWQAYAHVLHTEKTRLAEMAEGTGEPPPEPDF